MLNKYQGTPNNSKSLKYIYSNGAVNLCVVQTETWLDVYITLIQYSSILAIILIIDLRDELLDG